MKPPKPPPPEEVLRVFYQSAYLNGRYDIEFGEPSEDIETVEVMELWDELAQECAAEATERRTL